MRSPEKAPGLHTIDALSDSFRDLIGTVVDFGKETGGKAVGGVIDWVGSSIKGILGGLVNDLFALPIFPTIKRK